MTQLPTLSRPPFDVFALASARLYDEITRDDPHFPEPTDPAVVYVETLAGDIYLEERSDVNRYTLAFDRLRAASRTQTTPCR